MPGYSLHPIPFDVSSGATVPRLLDRRRCNLSHGLNVKTQWRFNWKWHLLLKCAGGRWNINFIKYAYGGLCTWSILIMWCIAHSAHVSANRAVVPLKVVTDYFCLSRSLHIHLNSTLSTLERCVYMTYQAVVLFALYGLYILYIQYMYMLKFNVAMLTDVNQWTHAGLLFWYFASVFVQSVQVADTGGPALRSASAATTAPATPSMAPASAFPAGLERIALRVRLNAFILHFFILYYLFWGSSLLVVYPSSHLLHWHQSFSWPHTSQNRYLNECCCTLYP